MTVRVDGVEPGEPSRLREVVARVQANETTRKQLEYVNSAAVSALVSPHRPAGALADLAVGSLGGVGYAVRKQVGVDAEAMRARVLVRNGEVEAALWFGDYEVAKADAWFAGNGGRREESVAGTLWLTAQDDEEVLSPNGCQLMVDSGAFNVVRTAPGSFGFSVAREPLAWLTMPSAETLAAEPDVADVAECRGDAVAAIVQQHGSGVTYAAGVHATEDGEVTEVVLARAKSADQARTMFDNATRACRDGPLPAAAAVTLTGSSESVVQVAWRLRRGWPVNFFLSMLTIRKFEIFGS